MTPKTINMDNLKLLAIVTGEGEFVNKNLRTGLWLSELTHIYHGAKKQGIEITVASPKGGDTPIDPLIYSHRIKTLTILLTKRGKMRFVLD